MEPLTALFIVFLILTALLFWLLLWLWGAYNSFVTKRNEVRTKYSDIDVQLKRRASLLENLVSLVKDYAKHEKDTFENVAKARSALDTSRNAQDAAHAENMLSQTMKSLFAVVENYPKLAASQNYQQLQHDLLETENFVAGHREEYNKTVQDYNNMIQVFPNLLAAALFKFEPEALFKV